MLDNYLRERAEGSGAKLYNGLFLRMEQNEGEEGPFTIQFSNYEDGGKVCLRIPSHDASGAAKCGDESRQEEQLLRKYIYTRPRCVL